MTKVLLFWKKKPNKQQKQRILYLSSVLYKLGKTSGQANKSQFMILCLVVYRDVVQGSSDELQLSAT